MADTEAQRNPKTHLSPTFRQSSIRRDFVFKVYSILACQLVLATAIIGSLSIIHGAREFCRTYPSFMYIWLVIYLVVLIAFACCDSARRDYPLNFVLLFILTLSLSLMAGWISAAYSVDAILISAGITCFAVISLTLLAKFGPDITRYYFILYIVLMLVTIVSFIVGIVWALTSPQTLKIWHLVISSILAIIISIYIVMDTQMILGGGEYQLSEEEYIVAAVILFSDIISLFLNILSIVGQK